MWSVPWSPRVTRKREEGVFLEYEGEKKLFFRDTTSHEIQKITSLVFYLIESIPEHLNHIKELLIIQVN